MWFETDVSGLPIGPSFNGQDVSWTSCPLKMEPIGNPETSASNHLTPRNNPEDRKFSSTAEQNYDFAKFKYAATLEHEYCCIVWGNAGYYFT